MDKFDLKKYLAEGKLLNEISADEISDEDILATLKTLLKSKEILPSSYHGKIDDMIRKLYSKIK
tara:strand:+ start:12825 stop:13016 length:192 start_codon:yes stop_codon:yes gene_type:complete